MNIIFFHHDIANELSLKSIVNMDTNGVPNPYMHVDHEELYSVVVLTNVNDVDDIKIMVTNDINEVNRYSTIKSSRNDTLYGIYSFTTGYAKLENAMKFAEELMEVRNDDELNVTITEEEKMAYMNDNVIVGDKINALQHHCLHKTHYDPIRNRANIPIRTFVASAMTSVEPVLSVDDICLM